LNKENKINSDDNYESSQKNQEDGKGRVRLQEMREARRDYKEVRPDVLPPVHARSREKNRLQKIFVMKKARSKSNKKRFQL